MEEKYNTFLDDPSKENLDTLGKAEELLISQKEYKTGKEYGDFQEDCLMALDFMDMLTESL
eukprot:5247144-Prorocentrum_lima.AAC.1